MLAVLFVAPVFAAILGLYLVPAVFTLLASLEPVRADIRFGVVFAPESLAQAGLQNYRLALRDPVWMRSIGTTAVFVLAVLAVSLSVSLGVALVLNKAFRGRGLVRALVLVPWAIAPVVNATMWSLVFHADVGTLNGLLHSLGLVDRYVIWLAQPLLAFGGIVTVVAWRFVPLMSLLVLAGLQSIPRELYESAEIDGANVWQRFRWVTLPGIRLILVTAAVIQMVWTTKVFDEIFVLTRGGPSYATMVMNLWIYRQAFEFLRFGYGSALAYFLTAFSVTIVLVYRSLGREER